MRNETRTTRGAYCAVVPGFELTMEIARPPEDVFAYLTDVSNLPAWQASARAAEADGRVRKGARIHERRSFMGKDVKTVVEVTAYEFPERFDLCSRGGPVSYEVRHELKRVGAATRLRVRADVKIGAMMRIPAQGPLKMAEREFRSDFERLKTILETQ
jgi:carbon monoxide dehydrogenase subunit G